MAGNAPLQSTPESKPVQQASNSGRRSWKDRNWESHKDQIEQIYMKEDNTLKMTMQFMEPKLGFKAEERTWKNKLKEWKFEKYLSKADMQILVAKAEKRTGQEDKETVFFRGGSQIPSKKFENFKKRKTTEAADAASLSVATPLNVTYHTPGPGNDDVLNPFDKREKDSLLARTRSDLVQDTTPPEPIDQEKTIGQLKSISLVDDNPMDKGLEEVHESLERASGHEMTRHLPLKVAEFCRTIGKFVNFIDQDPFSVPECLCCLACLDKFRNPFLVFLSTYREVWRKALGELTLVNISKLSRIMEHLRKYEEPSLLCCNAIAGLFLLGNLFQRMDRQEEVEFLLILALSCLLRLLRDIPPADRLIAYVIPLLRKSIAGLKPNGNSDA